jgi:hypothetical protein
VLPDVPESVHPAGVVTDAIVPALTVTTAWRPLTACGPAVNCDLRVSFAPSRELPVVEALPVGVWPGEAAAMFGVATTTVTADADHAAPRSAVRRVMPLSFERD